MTVGPVFSGPHAVARLGSRLAAILLALVPAIQARGATLDTVKARGNLVCGVTEGQPGFSEADERGVWRGLNVEFCGALAAAVLGKREAVQYRALMPADRFRAVTSGEVDILANGPPWTLSRDTELGVRFVDVLFYNGLGFLVPRDHAVSSVLELSGASVCQLAGSQAEQGIAEYFRTRKMRYQLVSSEHWDNLVRAYVAGGCTVLSVFSGTCQLSAPSTTLSTMHP